MSELGNVTLTVEFEIHATSVREAEKLLDVWLRPAEYDDQLKQYKVVKTEWTGSNYSYELRHRH